MTNAWIQAKSSNAKIHFKRSPATGRKTKRIKEFVDEVFAGSIHAARVESLANGMTGVVFAATLAIHAIGQAYARCANITAKSGVKQIDRLLSNTGVEIEHVLKCWARFVVANRTELWLAMDWTDFDDDNHTTLAVYAVTNHGRATPLSWRTFEKSNIKGTQKRREYEMIDRLHRWLDPGIRVTLLADRGFGDKKLYEFLQFLGWDYVIRFRGAIHVTSSSGERRTARDWLPPSGRATMLKQARVTASRFDVPAVVVVWDKNMKEPWCLATTLASSSASTVVKTYARRFTIEETFRDQKDPHFGMGLRATHIGNADRRDRLLLLAAMAHAFLTLLGAASERSGLDKYLKVNTVKRRTHSLYRQGLYWYEAIPDMRRDWLMPLMKAFNEIVREHADLCEILGIL
jgi:hypothetical protein